MNTFQLLWLQFLILLKKNLYVQKRNLLITILQVFERHTHREAACGRARCRHPPPTAPRRAILPTAPRPRRPPLPNNSKAHMPSTSRARRSAGAATPGAHRHRAS